MSMISSLAALAAASALSGQPAPAQERPETLARLMACRSLADNAARLICFDTAAGALDTAERQGEVVILDQAGVAETRRQLFGFGIASMPRLFGMDGGAEINAIETTLESAAIVGEGRWVFRLADGSVWRQIDYEPVRFQNRPGQPVRVGKAAMGSFLLTVGSSRAVRVRRQ
ncbi:hypothetical protein [Brevundimonas sp.]|uniref:hypothetical protein n=1 Tax=Brevundimonas sp. TaxID=1871086 RepID=UPI0035692CF5